MFKKLRYKFVYITSGVSFLILGLIVAFLALGIYVSNQKNFSYTINQIETYLNQDEDNKDKQPFSFRYYLIEFDDNGNILTSPDRSDTSTTDSGESSSDNLTTSEETKQNDGVTNEITLDPPNGEAPSDPGAKPGDNPGGDQPGDNLNPRDYKKVLQEVKALNKEEGNYKNFYYRLGSNQLILFDVSRENENFKNILIISSSVGATSLVIITLVSTLLSGKIVKPYEELYKKERYFMTNLSHELKTPLAIIRMNNEVLSYDNKDNEFIDSNFKNIDNMKKLIDDMINLSKYDEIKDLSELNDVNISDLLYEAIDIYKSSFISNKINFKSDIEEEVIVKCNEDAIMKVFQILFDNAVKYTKGDKNLNVSLVKEKDKAIIKFINNCDTINNDDLKHLFDRFYTVDKSHSKDKSGSGIGLSIAEAIIKSNNGKISATLINKNTIQFEIIL